MGIKVGHLLITITTQHTHMLNNIINMQLCEIIIIYFFGVGGKTMYTNKSYSNGDSFNQYYTYRTVPNAKNVGNNAR